jgi:hypothetical protein
MTITTSTVPSIVEITNSLFMGNTSIQSGGAIRIASEECAVTLSGCRISSNSSLAGGAIHCSSSNMTIENCVFENNIADIGSGIYIDSNQALLSECEFRGHQEALHCNGTGSGSVDIANCNFTENGIKSPYVVFLQTGSVATISGTTFCDNQATWDIYGAWADLGGNCIASSCSECDQDNCDADINNDGIVDGADLNILLGAWGVCP